MCGIAGVHAPGARVDGELLRAMAGCLVHRGPDGDGFHEAEEIGLGMRRLAIIDPEGGHQPLRNESGDVVVIFNGELYNHLELRRWLEGRGHEMRSGSDGEVIPHLYEELGTAFVERLNGIFAIAIWDAGARTLHLMRDRFGVKPLYHAHAGGRLLFASELRALLLDPAVDRELDPQAVDRFLTFRYVPSPATLFAGVRKLPPATVASSGPDGWSTREWATEAPEASRSDRSELMEEYRATFERAVVRQMMSDRPIGVMLSGGLDSAAITSVMARHSSHVRGFTVGFEGGDPRTDEIAHARETARMFGAEHESVVASDSEYVELLPGSLETLEEPVGATSALAVRFVARLMRPTVPVGLSGQGADEPLAGYGRYLTAKLAGRLRALPGARPAARMLAPRAPGPAGRALAATAAPDDLELLMAAYRTIDTASKERLYGPELRERLRGEDPPEAAVERLRSRVAHLDPLAQMTYVDTRLSLPDELLLIADKMSMAESLELRVPFLDPDLVDLVESTRSSVRLRGLRRKALHKAAMRDWLPREVVHRRKLGWETPIGRWMRGELRPLLEDVVLGEGGICRELFAEPELRGLVEAHVGGADRARQLFPLLSLGLWQQAFASGVPALAAARA